MSKTIQLSQSDVSNIQRAHAHVQILEEMYTANASDALLRKAISEDLGDAKFVFETVKQDLILAKLPSNQSNWGLDYATGVVTIN